MEESFSAWTNRGVGRCNNCGFYQRIHPIYGVIYDKSKTKERWYSHSRSNKEPIKVEEL